MSVRRRPEVAGLCTRLLAAPARLGGIRLVAIDGPAGSGKSTLAADLVAELSGRGVETALVHLDDLYEGWVGLPGVWDRLASSVLEPLAEGRQARFRRYDWVADAWGEEAVLEPPEVLVVEGCGSAPRRVDALASLRIWVEADAGTRLARGLERDGESLRDRWLTWMADEAAHFVSERTRERADVRLST